MVCTPSRVEMTRNIARKPTGVHWNFNLLCMVGGVPWRLSNDGHEKDVEAMKMRLSRESDLRAAAEEEVRRMVQKRMHIRRSGLQRYRCSERCAGCRPVVNGGMQQSRSGARRKRILGELGRVAENLERHRLNRVEFCPELMRFVPSSTALGQIWLEVNQVCSSSQSFRIDSGRILAIRDHAFRRTAFAVAFKHACRARRRADCISPAEARRVAIEDGREMCGRSSRVLGLLLRSECSTLIVGVTRAALGCAPQVE